VFHQLGIAAVRKARRKPRDDASSLLYPSQQQTAGVTGDGSAIEITAYCATI